MAGADLMVCFFELRDMPVPSNGFHDTGRMNEPRVRIEYLCECADSKFHVISSGYQSSSIRHQYVPIDKFPLFRMVEYN